MMAQRCRSMAIASLSLCTPKCMPSSTPRACPPLSRRRSKVSSGVLNSVLQGPQNHQHGENQQQLNGMHAQSSRAARRKVLRRHSGVFQEPDVANQLQESKQAKKLKKKVSRIRLPTSSGGSSAEGSGSESSGSKTLPRRQNVLPDTSVSLAADITRTGWSSRTRDLKMNGADIYIVRVTKTGCGNARPCWRCLEWCRWAGVKRIFHWSEVTNQFDMVKVNSAELGQYETHADYRLFAGLGY